MQRAMAMPGTASALRPFVNRAAVRRGVSAARPRIGRVVNSTPAERAEKTRDSASDDNPAEAAAKQFERDVVDPLVEKTKENSGLDTSTINRTAGATAQEGPVGAFAETQSFAGLAPEIINGRAAMVGFLAAAGAEIATRQPVLVQIQQAPVPILAAFGLIIAGSLAPIIRGADLARKGAGPFTPRAEVWNGRLAMVSFALLLVVETFKGGPGVVP